MTSRESGVEPHRSPQGTQAIDRAADLLARVIAADDGLTFSELCDGAGYARSTTSRLLTALERNDLLRRDGEGGYEPGSLFEQYAAGARRNERLVRLARTVMEDLGALTGESINLGVALRSNVVQIAQVDATYFLGSRNWVGVDLPTHTSALGKVLLAHRVIDVGDGPLETLTEHTVPTGALLRREHPSILADGFASTVDELEIGLTGVAAPVHSGGRVVAALGLSGPSTRLAHRIAEVGALVVDHAATLTAQLGTRRKRGAA